MSDDRTLLEKAAKAAGFDLTWRPWPAIADPGRGWTEWNPLTDDGDALRLAVKLKMWTKVSGWQLYEGGPEPISCSVICRGEEARESANAGEDPYAATRRAITRAAATLLILER
jgi:hypothetical protein